MDGHRLRETICKKIVDKTYELRTNPGKSGVFLCHPGIHDWNNAGIYFGQLHIGHGIDICSLLFE